MALARQQVLEHVVSSSISSLGGFVEGDFESAGNLWKTRVSLTLTLVATISNIRNTSNTSNTSTISNISNTSNTNN